MIDKLASNFAFSTMAVAVLGVLISVTFFTIIPGARTKRGFGEFLILGFFFAQLFFIIIFHAHYIEKYENGIFFVNSNSIMKQLFDHMLAILPSIIFSPSGFFLSIGMLIFIIQKIFNFYLLRPSISILICIMAISYGIYFGMTENINSIS